MIQNEKNRSWNVMRPSRILHFFWSRMVASRSGLLTFLPEIIVCFWFGLLWSKKLACHLWMISDSEPQSDSSDCGNANICPSVFAFHVHY
jgi:hypothetical protein